MEFHKDSLKIDAEKVADEICAAIKDQIKNKLHKTGAVIGISGGIDSSVVAALCTRALGPKRVVGIMMPEKDSAEESKSLAEVLAGHFGFETELESIYGGCDGLGVYKKRDEAIKEVFPYYKPTWKSKIVIPTNLLEKETFNFFTLVVETDEGKRMEERLPLKPYLQIVAATNYKQRLRMTTLYYHGEKRNWAVIGTGQKDEHMQGFFVKYGDGGTDLKPIAHLFKIQVFQLAEYLGVPSEILDRTPTTDTYSSEVTQEEFFYGLDFYRMDMLWYAMENNIPVEKAAEVLDLSVEQVNRAFTNIQRKITATEYLRMEPLEVKG
ncbi:MAG: NAD(+) synthase [Calditrichaeota bacterium]|nr:MAG: NAD(+) synthase [Calditrichota bacterium]